MESLLKFIVDTHGTYEVPYFPLGLSNLSPLNSLVSTRAVPAHAEGAIRIIRLSDICQTFVRHVPGASGGTTLM